MKTLRQTIKRSGEKVPFDLKRIANAIQKAGQETQEFNAETAEALSHCVQAQLQLRNIEEIGIEEIQDEVERTLMHAGFFQTSRAYIVYRETHHHIRQDEVALVDAISSVDEYVNQSDWRVNANANQGYSLGGMILNASGKITANYWLNKILPKDGAKAHKDGAIHIGDLDMLAGYTYFGKETVIARLNKTTILHTSLEALYQNCPAEELQINHTEKAFAKFPKNLEVLDKTGWTKITQLTKKKKEKQMHFLKSHGGRSIIVTKDHPIVTNHGEIQASEITTNKQDWYEPNIPTLLTDQIFQQKEIDILQELKLRGVTEFQDTKHKVHLNGVPIENLQVIPPKKPNDYLHTTTHIFPRILRLTEDFGYTVGLTVAEGMLSYTTKSNQTIAIFNENKTILKKAGKALQKELKIPFCYNEEGIKITNLFLKFLFKEIFQIPELSRHICLPLPHLNFCKKFNAGLLAGVLDGDGNKHGKRSFNIRVSSRTLQEQIATLLAFFNICARDPSPIKQGKIRIYNGHKIEQKYPMYGITFRNTGDPFPSLKRAKTPKSTETSHPEEKDKWYAITHNKLTNIPEENIYDVTTDTGTLIVNGIWSHNCAGWSLRELLHEGFNGVPNKVQSQPPKHYRTALGQMVNFLGTLQNEWAGAQAFSSFDTYLAPFVREDQLTYDEVKQGIQEFVFNMNVPSRWGNQTVFSNLTFDWVCPEDLARQPVSVGGKLLDYNYGDCQKEMAMINRAYIEVMTSGDSQGRVFTFPIPTYNITEDFDWEGENVEILFEMAAKYGLPYFQNFLNSDLKPSDVRSMCCRLRLNVKELLKRGNGLFGSAEKTGSIGVITLNLARIGHTHAGDKEGLYREVDRLVDCAKRCLEVKRKVVQHHMDNGFYPFTKRYLGSLKNHFSTIGINGANEMIQNFFQGKEDITSETGKAFTLELLDHLRDLMTQIQEETGHLYNLEATPAEGATYRFAKEDLKRFPSIRQAGTPDAPYYTNSSQLPVGYTNDAFLALDHQEELQRKYTGGTVLHLYMGERISSAETCKRLVKTVLENYQVPYITITPTFSICETHGYLNGEQTTCPHCQKTTEVWERVMGYHRPVSQWNKGKQSEHKERTHFTELATVKS